MQRNHRCSGLESRSRERLSGNTTNGTECVILLSSGSKARIKSDSLINRR